MEPNFEIKQETHEGGFARFVITPLVSGYGNTIGNALKRVLLSSIPGAAITSVKVSGVKHQFSTLKGMKEDILDFLLNLKKVRVDYKGDKPVTLSLSIKGAGEVKASQIKTSGDVSIANPDLVLANLSKGATLEAELEVSSGVGYSPAEERKSETIGLIPLDASFSPIVRVNYKVEETRVGRVTNFDKLILEVWTDETVDPAEAVKQASKILVDCFSQIVTPSAITASETVSEVSDSLGAVGKLSVEEIGLPTRVANALVKSGYETVEKLVNSDKSELTKVRNLGDKSLSVIKDALAEKGVDFPHA